MPCFTFLPQSIQTPLLALVTLAAVLGTTPAAAGAVQELQAYVAAAGKAADVIRGQQFFTAKHGREWSCSSCHTNLPTGVGKHASTGKTLLPLAPAFHAERFTDHAKTEKWFRRNCNDVVGRECSAEEKANILAWLITLQP